eukprot:scaffold160125_cov31-Tisochrysis_lutea.AAC.3
MTLALERKARQGAVQVRVATKGNVFNVLAVEDDTNGAQGWAEVKGIGVDRACQKCVGKWGVGKWGTHSRASAWRCANDGALAHLLFREAIYVGVHIPNLVKRAALSRAQLCDIGDAPQERYFGVRLGKLETLHDGRAGRHPPAIEGVPRRVLTAACFRAPCAGCAVGADDARLLCQAPPAPRLPRSGVHPPGGGSLGEHSVSGSELRGCDEPTPLVGGVDEADVAHRLCNHRVRPLD